MNVPCLCCNSDSNLHQKCRSMCQLWANPILLYNVTAAHFFVPWATIALVMSFAICLSGRLSCSRSTSFQSLADMEPISRIVPWLPKIILKNLLTTIKSSSGLLTHVLSSNAVLSTASKYLKRMLWVWWLPRLCRSTWLTVSPPPCSKWPSKVAYKSRSV